MIGVLLGYHIQINKVFRLMSALLSSVLFVNKVLMPFTCDNGSEKGTGVNENEHT